MASQRQLFIPLFLQTELERLAAAAGVDYNISDDSGESEYLFFMDQLTTKVENSKDQIDELQAKLQRQKEASENRKGYSHSLSAKEQKLLKQTAAFEHEVHGEIEKADEGLGYAEKINRLHQKFQKEKDQRKVLESYTQAQNKKIKVLVDHVEKLMKAVKIESNKRIHLIDENRRLGQEQSTVQLKADKQQRINTVQHRTIQELREGSKVLEDQLRLMDEKYLELKSKFDLAREQFNRKYKKMSKDNDEMKIFIRMNMGVKATMGLSANLEQQHSRPTSPFERMQISVPASSTNNLGSSNPFNTLGSSQGGNVAVGSGMNHVLSRKVQMANSSGPATAMSSSFIVGLNSKHNMSSPVADAVNTMQYVQDGFDPGAFRPMSATSPLVRDHRLDQRDRPYSAAATTGALPHSQSRKKNNKALNHVMDKITRHTGKKSVWSAERLSSLLEG